MPHTLNTEPERDEVSSVPAPRVDEADARYLQKHWSLIAAALCVLMALALVWLRRMDAAFVVATIGVVAWFWEQRNRLRERGIKKGGRRFREEEVEAEEEEFETQDEE